MRIDRTDKAWAGAYGALLRTATVGQMVQSYLEAAIWSSTDFDGKPLDEKFSVSDFSRAAVDEAMKDCSEFIDKAGDALDDLDDSRVGHDFWLTRNGHGAGFWDREDIYGPDMAQFLTAVARDFPEIGVFADLTGTLHFR